MNYQYLFFIRKTVNHTEQERNFLSRLLFNSIYTDNFNLNRAMIDLSFITKLKRSFSTDKAKSQLLIYYISPIKLPRIFTDLIQILESNEDKHDYDHLTKSEKYIEIGSSRIGKLTHSQAHYINKLIASTDFAASNILQTSNKPKLCNPYKNFHNGENFKS